VKNLLQGKDLPGGISTSQTTTTRTPSKLHSAPAMIFPEPKDRTGMTKKELTIDTSPRSVDDEPSIDMLLEDTTPQQLITNKLSRNHHKRHCMYIHHHSEPLPFFRSTKLNQTSPNRKDQLHFPKQLITDI